VLTSLLIRRSETAGGATYRPPTSEGQGEQNERYGGCCAKCSTQANFSTVKWDMAP
jgi:hypothetical protein